MLHSNHGQSARVHFLSANWTPGFSDRRSTRRRIMAILRVAHRVLGLNRKHLGLGQLGGGAAIAAALCAFSSPAMAQQADLGGTANNSFDLAIGNSAKAGKADSPTLNQNTAMGNQSIADGGMATAIGAGAKATGQFSTVVGYQASAGATGGSAFGRAANASGANATAVGYNSTASAVGAIAIGMQAAASSANAIAMGTGAGASGGAAVAIGAGNKAYGNGAVAIGDPSYASGTGAFTGGADNIANSDGTATATATNQANGAVAIGNANVAVGQGSVALGNGSRAGTAGALALGDTALASGARAIALGSGATAANANSVALGASSTTAAPGTGTTARYGATAAGIASAASGVVSVGSAGAARQIQNVAAGVISTTSTDAVNGSQLNSVATGVDALGTSMASRLGGGATYSTTTGAVTGFSQAINSVTTTGAVPVTTAQTSVGNALTALNTGLANTAAIAVKYDAAGGNLITLGATGGAGAPAGGVKITNVTPATLSAASTDAVNGSQLFTTNQNVTQNTTDIAGNTSAIAGNTTAITNLADSINDGTTGLVQQTGGAPGAGQLTVGATTGGTSVSFAGTDGDRILSNVAAGVAASDAVNVSQLQAVSDVADNAVQYDDASKANVTLGGTGAATPVALHNVAPAALSATSTDAVNGSQLFATNQAVDALGDTVTANATHYFSVNDGGTARENRNNDGATGLNSIAAGVNATASGWGGVAMGWNANAANGDVAIGQDAGIFHTAEQGNVFVGRGTGRAGSGTNNSFVGSIAGQGNNGDANVGVGSGAGFLSTGDQNIAIGNVAGSTVTGDRNIAIGAQAGQGQMDHGILFDDTISLGYEALANANEAIAIGVSAHATSERAVAIGTGASADGGKAVAIGAGNVAFGDGAVAIGDPSFASGTGAFTGGADNIANADGTATATAANAAAGAVAIGNANKAVGQGSVALGNSSQALGAGSLAFGDAAIANNAGDVALGSGATTAAVTGTSGTTIDGTAYAFAGAAPTSTVSVGAAGAERTITNVAAGQLNTGSTDVVNGSQLFATNQAVDALGTDLAAVGDRAVNYDGAVGDPKDRITLEGVSGTTLTNVADGALDAASTDAVNGSQLFETNERVTQNTTDIAGNTTAITNLADSINNGATGLVQQTGGAPGAGQLTVGAATGGTSVSFAGTDGDRILSNVAAGVAATDAVNVSQLQAVAEVADNAVQYDDATKAAVTLGGTGSATPVALTNVGPGILNAASTDAVNGGQLFATNSQVTQNTNDIANITTGGGIKYFHAQSALADSQADGTDSVAVGPAAVASNADSVALGYGAQARVDGALALGSGSVSDRAIAASSGSIPVSVGFVPYNTADGNLLGAVSVGDAATGTYRQITNVADGTEDHDAATIRQLAGAVGSVSNTTTKYFHANSTGVDALAIGQESIAVGATTVVNGDNGIGIGNGAVIAQTAPGGTAIGQGAEVSQADAVALGTEAQADGIQSIAIGAGANASFSGSVALGAGAMTTVGSRTDYVAYGLAAPQSSAGEVSVGAVGAERQVTNVAAGSAANDAVNVGQLNQVAQNSAAALGGGAAYDATTGAYTAPTYSVGGANYANVGDALGAHDAISAAQGNSIATQLGGGTTYDAATGTIGGGFTVDGTTYGDVASAFEDLSSGIANGNVGLVQQVGGSPGSGAITIGAATGGTSIDVSGADGNRVISGVADGIAEDDAVNVSQLAAAIAGVSNNAQVTAITEGRAGPFRSNNTSNLASADASGDDAVAGGFGAVASGARSTALGANATATGSNSVALGYGSSDEGRDNVVSVGAVGAERQISNVAAGTALTDAVNLGQLNDGLSGNLAQANAYTDGQIASIRFDLHDLGRRIDSGDARSAALAGIPQPIEYGQGMIGGAIGGTGDAVAFAIGASKAFIDGHTIAKAGVSYESYQNRVTWQVGVGYAF